MKRKIPLLPVWLFMGAIAGSPFLRQWLVTSFGVDGDAADSIASSAGIVLIIAALVVLWLKRRGIRPVDADKTSTTRFPRWRKRPKKAPH